MDVDAFAKTKGSKKGGKGKDKGSKSKKFDGNFWCGACGHMMEDCQKKASGKPQASKSPRGPVQCQSRSSPEVVPALSPGFTCPIMTLVGLAQ